MLYIVYTLSVNVAMIGLMNAFSRIWASFEEIR